MSPRLRSALAAACLTVAAAAPAEAAPIAYVVGFDALYRLDVATGAIVEVGEFGSLGAGQLIADVEGIAFSPDGTLYGVSDSQKLLFRIDPATAFATPVGRLRENGVNLETGVNLDFGLTFTCDGRLWASSERQSVLWEINAGDASMRRVGSTGAQITALAARNNELYGIGVDGSGGLYRVDRDTAQSVRVGAPFGRTFQGAGLDFNSDGSLWSVFYVDSATSEVFRVDPDSGVPTRTAPVNFTGDVDDIEIEALAFGPPPCGNIGGPQGGPPAQIPASSPVALGLLGILVSLFAMFGLRRRTDRRA